MVPFVGVGDTCPRFRLVFQSGRRLLQDLPYWAMASIVKVIAKTAAEVADLNNRVLSPQFPKLERFTLLPGGHFSPHLLPLCHFDTSSFSTRTSLLSSISCDVDSYTTPVSQDSRQSIFPANDRLWRRMTLSVPVDESITGPLSLLMLLWTREH